MKNPEDLRPRPEFPGPQIDVNFLLNEQKSRERGGIWRGGEAKPAFEEIYFRRFLQNPHTGEVIAYDNKIDKTGKVTVLVQKPNDVVRQNTYDQKYSKKYMQQDVLDLGEHYFLDLNDNSKWRTQIVDFAIVGGTYEASLYQGSGEKLAEEFTKKQKLAYWIDKNGNVTEKVIKDLPPRPDYVTGMPITPGQPKASQEDLVTKDPEKADQEKYGPKNVAKPENLSELKPVQQVAFTKTVAESMKNKNQNSSNSKSIPKYELNDDDNFDWVWERFGQLLTPVQMKEKQAADSKANQSKTESKLKPESTTEESEKPVPWYAIGTLPHGGEMFRTGVPDQKDQQEKSDKKNLDSKKVEVVPEELATVAALKEVVKTPTHVDAEDVGLDPQKINLPEQAGDASTDNPVMSEVQKAELLRLVRKELESNGLVGESSSVTAIDESKFLNKDDFNEALNKAKQEIEVANKELVEDLRRTINADLAVLVNNLFNEQNEKIADLTSDIAFLQRKIDDLENSKNSSNLDDSAQVQNGSSDKFEEDGTGKLNTNNDWIPGAPKMSFEEVRLGDKVFEAEVVDGKAPWETFDPVNNLWIEGAPDIDLDEVEKIDLPQQQPSVNKPKVEKPLPLTSKELFGDKGLFYDKTESAKPWLTQMGGKLKPSVSFSSVDSIDHLSSEELFGADRKLALDMIEDEQFESNLESSDELFEAYSSLDFSNLGESIDLNIDPELNQSVNGEITPWPGNNSLDPVSLNVKEDKKEISNELDWTKAIDLFHFNQEYDFSEKKLEENKIKAEVKTIIKDNIFGSLNEEVKADGIDDSFESIERQKGEAEARNAHERFDAVLGSADEKNFDLLGAFGIKPKEIKKDEPELPKVQKELVMLTANDIVNRFPEEILTLIPYQKISGFKKVYSKDPIRAKIKMIEYIINRGIEANLNFTEEDLEQYFI